MAGEVTELKNGLALSDVVAVVITTGAKSYLIRTASEVNLKPVVSAGAEKEQRKGNTIYAQNITEDIIKGYDIDFTDVLMNPEIMAIIDGGVVTNAADGAFQSYAGPEMGKPTIRVSFTTDIYCADKDTGGETKAYFKVGVTGCRGTPCEWAIKDGEFYTPKYTVKSRPSFSSSPIDITTVTELPTVAA